MLGQEKPVHCTLYRAGAKPQKFEKSGTSIILKTKVSGPVQTGMALFIVLKPKKDVSLRFRVNYRKSNVVAKRGAYPILRMEDCIDLLGDA